MDAGDLGLIGGIIGTVLGVAGGILGAYYSFKNSKGPRERAYMIKFIVISSIGIALFLTLLFTLPKPYSDYLWAPYGILLMLGIQSSNRKLHRIKEEESQDHEEPSSQ